MKVGDYALIVKKGPGWNSNGEMDCTLNKIGKITNINSRGTIRIKFHNSVSSSAWFYNKGEIRIVSGPLSTIPDTEFDIGDKIQSIGGGTALTGGTHITISEISEGCYIGFLESRKYYVKKPHAIPYKKDTNFLTNTNTDETIHSNTSGIRNRAVRRPVLKKGNRHLLLTPRHVRGVRTRYSR